MDYIKYLKFQLKRLNKIKKYEDKLQKSKKDSEKKYLIDCMNLLFESGENLQNYKQVTEEYLQALHSRNEHIGKLNREITIIKRLNPYQVENLI